MGGAPRQFDYHSASIFNASGRRNAA